MTQETLWIDKSDVRIKKWTGYDRGVCIYNNREYNFAPNYLEHGSYLLISKSNQ
jgi:hypothetical protein